MPRRVLLWGHVPVPAGQRLPRGQVVRSQLSALPGLPARVLQPCSLEQLHAVSWGHLRLHAWPWGRRLQWAVSCRDVLPPRLPVLHRVQPGPVWVHPRRHLAHVLGRVRGWAWGALRRGHDQPHGWTWSPCPGSVVRHGHGLCCLAHTHTLARAHPACTCPLPCR